MVECERLYNLYLELRSEVDFLKQERIAYHRRITSLETQMRESNIQIEQLKIKLVESGDEMSDKISKQFFEINLTSKVFKKESSVKSSSKVSSILAYGQKHIIVGGESNFLVSYNLGLNNKAFEYESYGRSEFNIMSVSSMSKTDHNLFATLEIMLRHSRVQNISLFNTQSNQTFCSQICIRKLDQKTILKVLSVNGKIDNMNCLRNQIIFVRSSDISSRKSSSASYSISFLSCTKEIIYDTSNSSINLIERETPFKNVVDMDAYETNSDIFELAVAEKDTIYYSNDTSKNDPWKISSMKNQLPDLISISFIDSNNCYTGHRNSLYLWQMNPILVQLRFIQLQSQFVSIKRFPYLSSSCIVVTESDIIFITKEAQKMIKAQGAIIAELADYQRESSKMKLYLVEREGSIQVYA